MEQIHGGDIYHHKNVIDFSANINPYGPLSSVVEAVKASAEKICNYPDIDCTMLRDKLAIREQIPPEWLIFGNGAAELIYAVVLAIKPKRALIQAPAFAEYEQALRTVNCDIMIYETKWADSFYIGEDILEQITEELDILFLCNPNNPTGTLTEPSLLRKMLEKCKRTHTYLVLDECFMDFILDREIYSMKQELKANEYLFLLKAFTKLYAMPGIRLGYGMSRNRVLLQHIRQVVQPWNVSVLAQAAGIAALEEEEYVNVSVKKIAEEKKYMMDAMRKIGFHLYESSANYIFFEAPENLKEICLEHGMLIRDCSNYRGLGKGYYRIAVKKREENEKLLALFDAIAQKR